MPDAPTDDTAPPKRPRSPGSLERRRSCKCCGQEIPLGPTLIPAELRAIRARLGWRLGYRELGMGLLPRGLFAHLLGVSDASTRDYLSGERTHGRPVRIPTKVALRARELVEMEYSELRELVPPSAERKLAARIERKRRWAEHKLVYENPLDGPIDGPEPPF